MDYHTQRHSGESRNPAARAVVTPHGHGRGNDVWIPAFAGMTPFIILLTCIIALSACTAFHPPKPSMPARDSLVAGQSITIERNQNVYAVARAHNVSMRDLIVLNNLQAPFLLKAGQTLVLPDSAGTGAGAVITSYDNVPEVGSSASSATSSSYGVTTLSTSQSIETVELAPPSEKPEQIKPSSTLTQVDMLNKPTPAMKPVVTTTAPAVADKIQKPVEAAKESLKTDDAQDVAAPSFIWPVQGPVLSSFGSKGQGISNDGVNIGAPKGSPVVASAGGIVAYAGNEMKGFGNLVLIRHQGGWVTAYAHLDRVLVNKDTVVASGDMIGTVGKTGTAATTQLHFEIRQGSKAIDPTTLIVK